MKFFLKLTAQIPELTKKGQEVKQILNTSSRRAELLFFIMTFTAIVPLYFESVRMVAGLVFLALLIALSSKSFKSKSYHINKVEKTWLYIAVVYASFFIIHYFVNTPYTSDGEWRNSAPIFILLFSYWYFLSIRLNLQDRILSYVALSSIAIAIMLFLVEITIAGSFLGYRYGEVSDGSRGIGAMGFILPITTILLAILWLQNRSWLYFVLMLLAVLLSGLNGSRTAFFMLLIPAFFGVWYLVVWSKGETRKIKLLLVASIIFLVFTTGYLAKNNLGATFTDFVQMEEGQYHTSMGLRIAMLDVGMNLLDKHWLLGTGPNAYKLELQNTVDRTEYSVEVKSFISGATQLHNQYLMTMVLSGILGFFTLLVFLLYPIKVFFGSFKVEKKLEPLLAMGLISGILFVMMFGAIFTYTYTTIFYMVATSSLVSFFTKSREGIV